MITRLHLVGRRVCAVLLALGLVVALDVTAWPGRLDAASEHRSPAAPAAHRQAPTVRWSTEGSSVTPASGVPASVSKGVVIIGKNAAQKGYKTRKVTIAHGDPLTAVNLDSITHTVTSFARDRKGNPLFDTTIGAGQTATVAGADTLAPGSYPFYCRIHPTMQGTLIVTGSGGGTHPYTPRFEQPLKTPRVIRGSHVHLRVARTPVRVLPHGPKTMMWTYGGSYPGPTIRRPTGHDTKVTVTDRLPAADGSLSVHLHGDHHPAKDDGQPDRYLIRSGQSRTYDYPLTDAGGPERSAFDFYHDHRMMETGLHNWYGMQGMFEVTDPRNTHLGLPHGRYDVPLMVADRSFDSDNQLTDPFTNPEAPPGDATVGDKVLVDGRYAPYLDVSTHRYRLRLLNSSNFQSYDFELSDGRPFLQIGNGDGLFAHPIVRTDILLGPAQRADVVVDFHGEYHRKVLLQSVPRVDNPYRGIGTPSVAIMQFRVTKKVADHSTVPTTLGTVPEIHAPKKVSYTWVLGLDDDQANPQWTINGRPYAPDRVDVTVPLGATRTWLIKNTTTITHYIHLHEEQWHTISRDGRRPPPWERGLEDTWRLDPGESVKVAATFTDYPGVYMIHCHMLDHEDDGMMAQFAVVRPGSQRLPRGYHLAGEPHDSSMTMPMGG